MMLSIRPKVKEKYLPIKPKNYENNLMRHNQVINLMLKRWLPRLAKWLKKPKKIKILINFRMLLIKPKRLPTK